MQTFIITRLILAILLIPMVIILGAVLAILLAFYALTIHPLLALLVVVAGAALIVGLASWEARRIGKEMPRDDS